jgi:hypothetical protein
MPQGVEADAGQLLRRERPQPISADAVRQDMLACDIAEQERRLSALAKSELHRLAITLPKCEPNLLAR